MLVEFDLVEIFNEHLVKSSCYGNFSMSAFHAFKYKYNSPPNSQSQLKQVENLPQRTARTVQHLQSIHWSLRDNCARLIISPIDNVMFLNDRERRHTSLFLSLRSVGQAFSILIGILPRAVQYVSENPASKPVLLQ